MRERILVRRVLLTLFASCCVVASLHGAGAAANSFACVEPPRGASAAEWNAKAEALGLHLCASVAESLALANEVQQRRPSSSRARAQPSTVRTACEDEILTFMCDAASSARTSNEDGFACSVKSADGSVVDVHSSTFRTCIAPLCEEICVKNDGANGKDALFCAGCASRRRGRFGSEFGAIWPSSTMNPLNLNAMFSQFTSQPLGQLMTSYLRVQATMWLIRAAFEAISQASNGGGGGTTLFPNLNSPSSTPSGGSSTIYFPPASPTPSPTPTPTPSPTPTTNQCGLSAPASHSCSNSCGLCVYPDASSDVPNCCCDSTCSDYGDCCVDATDCCPALKSVNARLIRARSRPNARLRRGGSPA